VLVLLGGPLRPRQRLEALVGYRLTAFDRDPVGALREPLLGSLDRLQVRAKAFLEAGVYLLLLEPGGAVGGVAGILVLAVVAQLRERAFDPLAFAAQQLAGTVLVHGLILDRTGRGRVRQPTRPTAGLGSGTLDTVLPILRSLRIAVVVALAGLLIPACGGGGGGSSEDETAVKQTVELFLHAVAAGDGITACTLATPEGQAKLLQEVNQAGQNCTQVVTFVSAGFSQDTRDGLATAKVEKVGFDGDTATVEDEDITSTQGDLQAFLDPNSPPTVLTRQPDGTWKLSG
jgi:hypothetical protein